MTWHRGNPQHRRKNERRSQFGTAANEHRRLQRRQNSNTAQNKQSVLDRELTVAVGTPAFATEPG